MSSFTTPLDLRVLDDGQHFELIAPFVYEIGAEGSGRAIRVPAGFVTDFASVPRGLWNLLPPTGRYGKAAVVHDWLYRAGCADDEGGIEVSITRKFADAVLLEAMSVLGVGWFTRRVIWLGVRLGGGPVWRRYRQEEEQEHAD